MEKGHPDDATLLSGQPETSSRRFTQKKKKKKIEKEKKKYFPNNFQNTHA
jgi:carbonic anhydrase/acetyltransferase-like protein (isoleucine patch superfamily)